MADPRRAPLKDQTDISGSHALIVEARFYDDIQDALLEAAIAELKQAGVQPRGHHRAGRAGNSGCDRDRARGRGEATAAL